MGDVAELVGAIIGTVLWGFLLSLAVERWVKSDWLNANERAIRVSLICTGVFALLGAWGNARGADLDLIAGLRHLPGGFILWAIKRKQYQRQIDRANDQDTFA